LALDVMCSLLCKNLRRNLKTRKTMQRMTTGTMKAMTANAMMMKRVMVAVTIGIGAHKCLRMWC
jgi:hypothetical protein